MSNGGTVSIDIADHSQSVTRTVKEMLGDDVTIAPEDVTILSSGWLRLKRDGDHLYISPNAVSSVLIEGGELSESE